MSTSPFEEYKAGTPKSLDAAILLALSTCPGPATVEKIVAHIKSHVRDYISQPFATAYLRTESRAEEQRLELLWKRIVGGAE